MQRRLPMRLLVLFVVAWTASAQAPKLVPRVLLPGDAVDATFWLRAPSIAVVRVDKAEWVGPEIEVTPPKKIVVRLVRITARIENVIQGEVRAGAVTFFFFANTLSRNGYHTVLSWMEAGKRYVVFLRDDGGVLRTMADVADVRIPILTGYHDRVSNLPDQRSHHDPGNAIAYLALTPTGDADSSFGPNIERLCGAIAEFVPPSKLAELLRKLLLSQDSSVAEHSCLTLSRRFSYRDPCFQKLMMSNDDLVRQQARTWSEKQWNPQQLVKTLRENPFSLSISGSVSDLPSDLEQFTFDSDVAVRVQACETLHYLFPARLVPTCRPGK